MTDELNKRKDHKPTLFGHKEAAALATALLISIIIYVLRDELGGLVSMGYLGVFLLTLLGNATLILPAPAMVLVFLAGGALGSPLLVGLVAGLGSTFGEFTGYLAGYSGNKLVERSKTYGQIKSSVDRYGVWAIGLLAFIPNPLFDLAGMAAGALKIKWSKFLLATLIGKTCKTILIAYAGSFSIDWAKHLL